MNEDGLNMYIEHLDEIRYVPTVEIRTLEFTNNNKCAQIQMTTIQLITVWDLKLAKETAWGDTWKREELRRKSENGNLLQRSCIDSKPTRDKKNQAARKRKLNPEHVREIEQCSSRKRKAKNSEHMGEI